MQPQRQVPAQILQQVPSVSIHHFYNNNKRHFTTGPCKFAKITNEHQRVVNFYYTLTKNIVFVKVQYPQSVSFLFPYWDNGLSAISIPANAPQLHNIEQILKNTAVLTTYEMAMNDPQIRYSIQVHCPYVKNQQINADKFKLAISKSGKYLGQALTTAGNYLSKGIQFTGNFLSQKIQQGKKLQKQYEPEAKKKWESLKNGTGQMVKVSGQYAQKAWKPIKETTNQWGKQISESKNQNVVYAREIADSSGKAAKQTWNGLIQASGSAATELTNQSKKLLAHLIETNVKPSQQHLRNEDQRRGK